MLFGEPQKKHLHPKIRHALNGLQGCLRYKCVVLCRAMGDEDDEKKIGIVRSSLDTVRKIEVWRVEYVSEAFAKFILHPTKYYLVEELTPDNVKQWLSKVFWRDEHGLPEDFDVVAKWRDEQRRWVAEDGPLQHRMKYWSDFEDEERQLRIYQAFQHALLKARNVKLSELCGRPIDPNHEDRPANVSLYRWEQIKAEYDTPCWTDREFNRKYLIRAFYWRYDYLNDQSKEQ